MPAGNIRKQESEVNGPTLKLKCKESNIKGRKSEVKSKESEEKTDKSEINNQYEKNDGEKSSVNSQVPTDVIQVSSQRNEQPAASFEDILEMCCGDGMWQILLIGLMSFQLVLQPFVTLSIMYIGATPDFKCADGFDVNATFAGLPYNTPHCHALNSSDACSRWVYDQSVYLSTVVTEWDLVCGRKSLLSMLQSWIAIGGMVSAAICGQLSDRFGRRAVSLGSLCLVIGAVFAAVGAPSYSWYAATRFVAGGSISSLFNAQYIVATEISGAAWRGALSFAFLLPFGIGLSLMAACSYFVRSRWLLQLIYAVPFLLLLANFQLMPESPRWLVHHGRFKEAFAVLRTAARWNGKQMSPEKEVCERMEKVRANIMLQEVSLGDVTGSGTLQKILKLFQTPRMRLYTMLTLYIRFAITCSFYGISLGSMQLSTSPHLTGVLLGIISIPSYLVFPLLTPLGRRLSAMLFFFTGAASMLLVFVKQDTTVWLVLGLVGYFNINAAAGVMYVYMAEYMPTTTRGAAFGAGMTATRLGAVVAPFVVDMLVEVSPTAPSGVFGGLLLLAGLSCLMLPETRGRPMPETVADVERRETEPERVKKMELVRVVSLTAA